MTTGRIRPRARARAGSVALLLAFAACASHPGSATTVRLVDGTVRFEGTGRASTPAFDWPGSLMDVRWRCLQDEACAFELHSEKSRPLRLRDGPAWMAADEDGPDMTMVTDFLPEGRY